MDLEKIFNDEYNAYSEIQHLMGGKIVNESMPCINKEKFIEVVKKLRLHNISQQRELLLAFSKYVNGRIFSDNEPFDEEEVNNWLANEN